MPCRAPVSRRDSQRLAGGEATKEREPPDPRVERNAPRRVRENGPLAARFCRPCRGGWRGCGEPVVPARSSLHHRLISGSPSGTPLRDNRDDTGASPDAIRNV